MSQKIAYTFAEASVQSGYSERTLKHHVSEGTLIAKYANSKGIIRHADLEAWIDGLPEEAPAR